MKFFAVALVLASCVASPVANSSPTAHASVTTTPSPEASSPPLATPSVSPAPVTRFVVNDGSFGNVSEPVILFQAAGDERLRALTWDGSRNGQLGGKTSIAFVQSPSGSRYAARAVVYELDGRPVGPVPWGTDSFTWTPPGDLLCKAVPLKGQTGSPLLLATAAINGPVNIVATGFGTFSDNASYPVLACDPKRDRAVVASFGQGLFAGRVWMFELSTGRLVRSTELGQGAAASWLAASQDGSIVAESIRMTMNGPATTTLRRSDDGVVLTTIPDFEAWGFSGDASVVYGFGSARQIEVREAGTGRLVWTATHPMFWSFLPEPSGGRVAIALGDDNALRRADVYVVSPNGTSRLLANVTTGFH